MGTQFFYVLYLADPAIQYCLDVIRFLANPAAKGLAHITVRGPYFCKPDINLDILQTEGQQVSIRGIGDFFSSGQTTVYLQCDGSVLKRRWYKPDYEYRPHITLYDGPDSVFAKRLRKILTWDGPDILVSTTGLSRLESQPLGAKSYLRHAIQSVGLSGALGNVLNSEDIDGVSDTKRLKFITTVWKRLLSLNHSLYDQGTLFDSAFPAHAVGRKDPKYLRLDELVVAAYLRTHRGASVDRTIADPEVNLRFLTACWKLGRKATQCDLNRARRNTRKIGKVGPVPDVVSRSVDRKHLEQYLFATEIALRIVQDEEWFSHQQYVSLDRILCEPALSYRFDSLSRLLAPGYASGDYRWAAISIRKSQHRHGWQNGYVAPSFGEVKSLGLLRPAVVSCEPGFYWLRHNRTSLYFGHADDLRGAVDRVLALNLRELPLIHRSSSFRINVDNVELLTAPALSLSLTGRDRVKSQLVERHRPGMNAATRSLLVG